MSNGLKNFHVQLIGPSGIVHVHEKPQEFIESGRNIQEVERQIEGRQMAIDPINGTSKGHFLGCWMYICELPDEEDSD